MKKNKTKTQTGENKSVLRTGRREKILKQTGNKTEKRQDSGHRPFYTKLTFLIFAASLSVPYIYKLPTKQKHHMTEDDCGGWNPADAETNAILYTETCDIDRIPASNMTAKEFETVYRYKKPVLLQFKNGARDWTNMDLWNVSSMLGFYGDRTVVSGTSENIVRKGGRGVQPSSLRKYIEKLRESELNSSREPMYIFDRDFYKGSDLPKSVRLPPYLRSKGEEDSIFLLGGSKSGVAFHQHADAWNGVIYGRKRWFLYPLQHTPPGGVWPGFSILDWFHNLYPNLTEDNRPLECIQQPGEIMYVPEGMYHATLNIGDTVAFGVQKRQANTEAGGLFYKVLHDVHRVRRQQNLSKDKERQTKYLLVSIFERLAELLPENAEVQMKLGKAYLDVNEDKLGMKHTQRAIDMDPYFVVALLNKAAFLTKVKRFMEAELTYRTVLGINPNFHETYGPFGELLFRRRRYVEALAVFKQGSSLRPDIPYLWNYLAQAQQRVGDNEGAAESLRRQQELEKT